MSNIVDVFVSPRISERRLKVEHIDEMVLLDKEPYTGELPVKDYGVTSEVFSILKDPKDQPIVPRSNTYVLNIRKIGTEGGVVKLESNYTNMRSQFAERKIVPLLPQDSKERKLILKYVLPIGAAMVIESAEGEVLIEARSKNVQLPEQYCPAPAGGVETRNWRVRPDPFRSIKGESWEEVAHLPGQDYSDVDLLGLARDQIDGLNPTLVFNTESARTIPEIRELADSIAPEAGEHQRLLGMPVDEKATLDYLLDQHKKFVGNGLGAVLVFGDHKFGRPWYNDTVARLKEKDWEIRRHEKTFPSETFS